MTRRNMGGAQPPHPRDWHEREALTMGAQMANRAMGGRYTVQDKIGTGGMAIVYRGLDEVLGRTVAIKTMLPQYANDESFAARFKQEAQAASAYETEIRSFFRKVGFPDLKPSFDVREPERFSVDTVIRKEEPEEKAAPEAKPKKRYVSPKRKDWPEVTLKEVTDPIDNIRFTGDTCSNEENLNWVNSLKEGRNYTQCMILDSDFHSPLEERGAWEADKEYENWNWVFARADGGDWELLNWGY